MELVTFMDDLRRQLDQDGSLLLLLDLMASFDTVDYDLMTYHLTDIRYGGLPCNDLSHFSMVGDKRWCLGRAFHQVTLRYVVFLKG